MRKSCILIPVILLCAGLSGWARETFPTIRLGAADIEQDSIKQVRWSTNGLFAIKWNYTEAGAKRMVEFWNQHPEQKVCIEIGTFETPPFVAPGPENPVTHQDWRPAWIKRRTDRMINLSDADAKAVVEGMRSH